MKRSLIVVVLMAADGHSSTGRSRVTGEPLWKGDAEPVARGRIDELVFGRLKRLGIAPAGVCSDGVFLAPGLPRCDRHPADGRRGPAVLAGF